MVENFVLEDFLSLKDVDLWIVVSHIIVHNCCMFTGRLKEGTCEALIEALFLPCTSRSLSPYAVQDNNGKGAIRLGSSSICTYCNF